MMRHHVDGPASVHVLSGRLTVDADGKGTELPAGGVVVFDEGIEHDVGARTDCSFLITIAWRD
jgi:quercetin dioxygenase-like cupin family protein